MSLTLHMGRLASQLERHWRVALVLVSVLVAVLVAAGMYFRSQAAIARGERTARAVLPAPAPASSVAPVLQTPPQVERLVSVAQQAAALAGVAIRSISIDGPVAAHEPPAHADVVMEFRGTYPALKLWLGDMLERFDNLAVVSLEMRATDGPSPAPNAVSLTQGQARLRLFAQPMVVSTAAAPVVQEAKP